MISKSDKTTAQSTTTLNGDAKTAGQLQTPTQCRFILVYNSTQEFLVERTAFWNDVIPELQATAHQLGVEIEFSDYLITEEGEQKLSNRLVKNIIAAAKKDENVYIIAMLGDLYGEPDAPVSLKKEEFECIQTAAFEQSQDVKFLKDFYIIDRTRVPEEYRTGGKTIRPDQHKKLISLIHSGAKTAYDDGVINQSNPERQQSFFYSPIHTLAYELKLANLTSRAIFTLRKFEDLKAPLSETDQEKASAIAQLKNELSEKMACLSFNLPGDGATFLTSNKLEKYKDEFSRQLTDKLKEYVQHYASNFPQTWSYAELSRAENDAHVAYAERRNLEQWIPQKKNDSRIEKILGQTAPGMYLVQGPTECGKTRQLCRAWKMIGEKKPDAIRIIRFVNHTYSCIYAHEMWYNMCISMCEAAGVPNVDVNLLLSQFNISNMMNVFSTIIEKSNKTFFVFIDDIHAMKMGRLLCPLEKKSRKIPANMIIIGTCLNVAVLPQLFAVTSTINLETTSESDIVEIARRMVPPSRTLSSQHAGSIQQQLTSESRSFTLAFSLIDEILHDGDGFFSGGLIGRLTRLESRYGEVAVGSVCKVLLNARIGITRCELIDFLSSDAQVLKSIGSVPSFPPVLLDNILTAMGTLLSCVFLDGKYVIRPSSMTTIAVLRARYSADKVGVCGGLAALLHESPREMESDEPSLSPRPLICHVNFPRTLKRENGCGEHRVIRQLWLFLLHTGDMDALKHFALCNFHFIDLSIRTCGVAHLLSMYEDTLLQVLHHDIQVLAEQVLLPALPTIVRDGEQVAAEMIGRLRYTRAENSHFLNWMVEEAMSWVDEYSPRCLLVPLSCWIAPPQLALVLTFDFKDWKNGRILLVPTFNHQHILVSGNESAIGEIYMVHIASQFVLATYRGHTGAVTSLCESSEGNFFTSTSVDKTVRVWYRNSDESVKVLRPHAAKVTCSVLSANNAFLVTGSADSSAKVIDLASGNVTMSFPDHTGTVVSVQLTSNDRFLITGSGDFSVQMWSMLKGEIVCRMGGLMAPVTCIAITSNDAFVGVACEDETLRVFGTVSSQELHDMSGHEGKINGLVAAHDDCQLFAATLSRIYCYDIHTGQIVCVWDTGVNAPVSSLQITSDNFFLISGCGTSVHVWSIRERVHDGMDVHMEAEGHVTATALSNDNKMAACGAFVRGCTTGWTCTWRLKDM